jgi:hypothetical protein
MCKEMPDLPVIPVNRAADPKRIIGKRMTEEEERHKESLTPPPPIHLVCMVESG